ncbi:hypothetical protein ACIOD1_12900 [Streptomyces sp. NPDC088097]|uniref:hypothetical protein n=1 Tax=Streptomyces sp. NPDC088097 TaxID=3365823 RepID=UPI00381A42FC
MTRTHSTNSLAAELGTPEIITDAQGYQQIRIPLVTETGTIVYADVSPFNAKRFADGIGRISYAARQHNATQPPAPPKNDQPQDTEDSHGPLGAFITAVRQERGIWTEDRVSAVAERHGYRLDGLEAHEFLEDLERRGLLRWIRVGQYETRT